MSCAAPASKPHSPCSSATALVCCRPPFTSEYGEPGPSRWQRAQLWFSRNVLGEQAPQPTSGYLTLVPLNDRRLQPRRTALLVTCLVRLREEPDLTHEQARVLMADACAAALHGEHHSRHLPPRATRCQRRGHCPAQRSHELERQQRVRAAAEASYRLLSSTDRICTQELPAQADSAHTCEQLQLSERSGVAELTCKGCVSVRPAEACCSCRWRAVSRSSSTLQKQASAPQLPLLPVQDCKQASQ